MFINSRFIILIFGLLFVVEIHVALNLDEASNFGRANSERSAVKLKVQL